MNQKHYIQAFLVFLLLLFVFFEPDKGAIVLTEHTEKEAAESLIEITAFKGLVSLGASSHIPGVSGVFSGMETIVDDAFEYVAVTNILLSTQLILQELSKSWFFKLLIVFFLTLFLFNISANLSFKIILILLLINPGIGLFVNGVSFLHQELGSPVTADTKHKLKQTRSEAEKHLADDHSKEHLERNAILNAHADHPLLKHVNTNVVSHTIHKEPGHKIKKRIGHLLKHILHSFVSAILLFLFLPFLYAIGFYYAVKKLTKPNVTKRFESTLLIVLLFGAGLMTISAQFVPVINEGPSGSNETEIAPSNEDAVEPFLVQEMATAHDTLKGIDVSHYNGDINWKDVQSERIHFGYAKATEGIGFKDPKFKENWSNMKLAEVARGAYHFYVANDDPVTQAQFYISTVESISMEDMPPMLDLEGKGIGGLSREKYMKNVLEWLKIVHMHFKRRPIIYCDPSFARKYLTDPEFARYHLWIAEYPYVPPGKSFVFDKPFVPDLPKTWNNKKWTIWQHTSREKMVGINGITDGDILVGDATVLFKESTE